MKATRRVSGSVLLLSLLFGATAALACNAPPWDSALSYSRGDIVSYQLHEWRAKRSTTGVVPGTHKPTWADLGQCASDEPPPPSIATPIQIFGVWHAGNHYADWSIPREFEEFDAANHWIINRGDGMPSVNLVVLSFVHPMRLLQQTTDAVTVNGVPIGMTQEIVDYFVNADIRVMMSIGGVTYTDAWEEALATDATQLGLYAAAIADHLGVGIEIA